MTKHVALALCLISLGVLLGLLWAHGGLMASASAQTGTTVVPVEAAALKNPVVSCTPFAYTTEIEEDPFNPERTRRTRTTLSSVLVVHADGTTEVKKATGG